MRRLMVCGLMALLLAGCDSTEGQRLSSAADQGELSGEVFIVTQGGPSIKLGLVTVVAIPDADMQAHIKGRREAAVQLADELIPRLQAARAAVEAANRAVAQVDEEADAASKQAHQKYMACLGTAATRGECDAARPTYTQIRHDLMSRRRQEVKTSEAALSRLNAEGDVLTSSQFYMSDLPPGIATAKTNADGLFTMSLPRTGKFALAARASRQILGETEDYYWLVWASLDGASSTRIMLSNDNLTTVESPESVIKLPR